MAKPDWSRVLPEPIDAGKRKKLRTLKDVSEYLLALPPERQVWAGWQGVARRAIAAAEGGDLNDVVFAFKFARKMYG